VNRRMLALLLIVVVTYSLASSFVQQKQDKQPVN
jgi:hypothetical protein